MANLPGELRRLRLDRKWSQERLAAELHVSKSLISAFESGKLIPQEDTAQTIDQLFGTGEQIQKLVREAMADRRPWLRPWREIELRAAILRSWEPTLIPALAQVEEYARAIFPPDGGVDDLVAARLEHGVAVLDRIPAPRAYFVISEVALRQGPPEIRRVQLAHLIELSRRPTVSVRALPNDVELLHLGLSGPVALATLPDGRRLGYVDDALRGSTASNAEDLQTLEVRWEAVSGLALTTAQTQRELARMIDELE